MEIKLVEKKEEWESVCNELQQSWSWGDFLDQFGVKIWRLGIYNGDKLIGVALARLVPSRFRKHICVTNGPILKELKVKREELKVVLEALNNYLIGLARTQKACFVRIEFPFKSSPENEKFIKNLGFQRSAMSVQAETNWILDISRDEEKILSEMRKSTRYEIKNSEKKGVKVSFTTEKADFDKFWKIFEETFTRQKFTAFPKSYLLKQMEVLGKENNYFVALAHNKEGKLLSGALFAKYKDTFHYLQASSANLLQSDLLYAPKLIIWEAIKKSKALGCTKFDFHGIAPDDNPKHSWFGISQFKKSFGGYEEKYLGAYDIPMTPQYRMVRLIEKSYKYLRT